MIKDKKILNYLASIGIRAENTKANKVTYQFLVNMTFELFSQSGFEERLGTRYLYLLDCVAQNILKVPIFAFNYVCTEPKEEALKMLYEKTKQIHDSNMKEDKTI